MGKLGVSVPAANKLTILIADDHAVMRQGIRTILEAREGWCVCAEAATGDEAVTLARRHKPDVVVLDYKMPGKNSISAAKLILKSFPDLPILFFTLDNSKTLVRRIFAEGGRGFLLKEDAGGELVTAVQALSEGKLYVSPKIQAGLLDDIITSPSPILSEVTLNERLTPRQTEILTLVALGHHSKDIAQRLELTVKTVEAHRANIRTILGLHNTADLTRYYMSSELSQ